MPLRPLPPNDPAGPQDAYADLAPDPVDKAMDATEKHDWFSEFPDEARTPRKPRPTTWKTLTESLKDEKS